MKLITIAFLAIMLSSCSLFHTKPIEVSTAPIERIPLNLPSADLYHKRDITWVIITPENAEKIFLELTKTGEPVALIGVTGSDYELLALANGDKQLLIKQLQAQISAYKSYYIAVEERDAAHNKKAESK